MRCPTEACLRILNYNEINLSFNLGYMFIAEKLCVKHFMKSIPPTSKSI